MSEWQSPKRFLRGRRLRIGQILDPDELEMPRHPTFGKLPVLKVLETFDDCSLLKGEITCCVEGCNRKRIITAGDWFQVRRCQEHQKLFNNAHPESRAKLELDKARTKVQVKTAKERKQQKQEEARKLRAAERAAREKKEEEARNHAIEEERKRLQEERASKHKFKVIRGGF